MKKHLWGFALFNLIVGTALIIAIMTGNFRRPAAKYTYDVSKQSCWKNVRQNSLSRRNYEKNQNSIKVTQAVLDEKTDKLNMSFSIQRETPSTQQLNVRLTFVNGSYEETGGKFDGSFRSESITLSPSFDVDNKAVFSMPLSYKWLKSSDIKENFYVMAEIDNGNLNKSETVARRGADLYEFTPILSINEK